MAELIAQNRILYINGKPVSANAVVMKSRAYGRTEQLLSGKQIYDYFKSLQRVGRIK
jgi:hypothetical protein